MKVGLLFPDYGSQFVGMGKDLYDTSRLMQEYFEEASNCLNLNFVKLCFASSDLDLGRLDHAYPALFLISSSIAAIVQEQGIKPVAIAGYNLGAYAALHTAGSLSLPDGFYFLSKYAQLYQQLLEEQALRTIGITGIKVSKIKTSCEKATTKEHIAVISAYNTDTNVVVAGHASAVDQVANWVFETGGGLKDLPVEAGMHSSIMEPIVQGLDMYAEKIDIKDANVPIVAGIDGMARTDGASIALAVVQQVTEPVRWDKVMAHVAAWDLVIEIGPGSTLTKLVKAVWPDKLVHTVNKMADIEQLATLLKTEQSDTE